jgi:hypothetical protein
MGAASSVSMEQFAAAKDDYEKLKAEGKSDQEIFEALSVLLAVAAPTAAITESPAGEATAAAITESPAGEATAAAIAEAPVGEAPAPVPAPTPDSAADAPGV